MIIWFFFGGKGLSYFLSFLKLLSQPCIPKIHPFGYLYLLKCFNLPIFLLGFVSVHEANVYLNAFVRFAVRFMAALFKKVFST